MNTKQSKKASVETQAPVIKTDETINSLCVKAFATIILKGDKHTVDVFRAKLEERKQTALATIKTNFDNGVFDKQGLPKGSAPNDLYNTISETQIMAETLQPENKERVELAANTIRSFIATVCSEISNYKTSLVGKSAKTRTSTAKDESYI